jgi:hypothetical protein
MPHNKQNQFRASTELSFSRTASDSQNTFLQRSVPDKPKSDWWSPLRRGLIIEPSAKHHKQMKQAVWLYLYCLLNADGKTGTLFRRLSTIAKDSGIPKRTIRRWLRILRQYGYINAEYNGHFWQIAITKWKPISSYSKRNHNWLNRFKNKFLASH